MNEDVIFRYINGRIRPIKVNKDKTTNQYMNDKIREKTNKEIKPEKLNELEYEALCDEFEENLTEEEKKRVYSYGVGSGVSYYLNNPTSRDFERTYRFLDPNNPKGYVERKMSYLDALNAELDKKGSKFKTGDKDWDENIEWNYDMIVRDKKILNEMDNIFEKKGISLDKDIIVYRKGHETLEDLQVGYTRRGYTSTSAKSRINKQTPGHLVLGSNEFEIIVPKGMKFLPIKNVVPDDVKFQNEILLPRNLKFMLIEDKSNPGGWNSEKLEWEKKKNKYVVRVTKE